MGGDGSTFHTAFIEPCYLGYSVGVNGGGSYRGWPVPKGGSQQLANALAAYFVSLGGKIETGFYVKSLKELPSSKALLFDITPRQF